MKYFPCNHGTSNLVTLHLYQSHNALGHNDSTRLYNFTKGHNYWRKWHQHCYKYVRSCPDIQQMALKGSYYVDLHHLTPSFPMSFISMDIFGLYHETDNVNQYTLSYAC